MTIFSLNDRYLWECSTKGDKSTPFVSLEFGCEVVPPVYIYRWVEERMMKRGHE